MSRQVITKQSNKPQKQTHVRDVAAVCNVPDARQGHLLGEGLPKAGQALGDLAAQQRGGAVGVDVVLDDPLQGPWGIKDMRTLRNPIVSPLVIQQRK